ncbi:DUF4192 domain-containing protein [Nocardia sp. NPDC088792]|uniref:DUF4192 domain-containing protein n=1 Tax=Nocardia sp. NPDC088792 TaxID=3364332 RepID=UPI0037FCDBA2
MSRLEVIFKEPGQFIAAVPALVGFVPERSMVVAMVLQTPDHKYQVHTVTLLDLAGQYPLLRDRFASVVRNSEAIGALAVIVDDRAYRGADDADAVDAGQRRLIETLRQDLAGYGVALAAVWAVACFSEATEWWEVESPWRRGLLPDPSASHMAAAQVLAGRALRPSRAALSDVVAVDEVIRKNVAAHLPDVAAEAQRRLVRAIQIDNPDAFTRLALCHVMSVIVQARELAEIPARIIAEVAVALRDSAVRDIMFGVAGGVHEPAAEYLWGVLTRALPDPDRAQAATLLAFHAYRRGDGPLARVALEQALASDPEHRMARLLDAALQSGLDPARLQRVVNAGIEAAADMQVDIGCAAGGSGVEVVR